MMPQVEMGDCKQFQWNLFYLFILELTSHYFMGPFEVFRKSIQQVN